MSDVMTKETYLKLCEEQRYSELLDKNLEVLYSIYKRVRNTGLKEYDYREFVQNLMVFSNELRGLHLSKVLDLLDNHYNVTILKDKDGQILKRA